MSWTGRPSLPALHVPTAEEFQAVLDQISSLTAPGWTGYGDTFEWTSDGTPPDLGDASVSARYRRPAGMDLVVAEFSVTFGSLSGFGSGAYFFSLPMVASSDSVALSMGSWYAANTGVQHYSGALKVHTSTTVLLVMGTGAVTSLAPFTFGAGDVIRGQVTYEPA